MTAIDAALRAKLSADSPVAVITGGRIYIDRLPINPTLPAISLHLVSEIPHDNIPNLFSSRVQISCWSDPASQDGIQSPAEVMGLSDAVKTAVSKTKLEAEPAAWTVGTTTYSVHGVRVQNAPRMIDPVTNWYHVPVDLVIEFRRNI
jgi:hypothetical protein